ncbi:MAG: hypothetical protein EOP09_02405 [Proteobacteria bacterium]|nr:MAG: hypothetical protein EOP09_02405 [Pseudomonadota bacterium]
MLAFFLAQIMSYILLVCPGSDSYRLVLALPLCLMLLSSPLATIAGVAWQSYSLDPNFAFHAAHSPIIQLRCDQKFWFICENKAINPIIHLFSTLPIGEAAIILRDTVHDRCLAWDKQWGPFLFSLIMGGTAPQNLKVLYRNLGFLHVLVISGSQFSLISEWLDRILSKPFQLLYASTALNWKQYRESRLLIDILLQLILLIYLLACGATPPCQRAFLEHSQRIYQRWLGQPEARSSHMGVMQVQLLIFPETFFSLSNFLSWGAITSLRALAKTRTLFAQLRTSACIQLLSLALFSRISLSALVLDFFLAPLWDYLLFAAVFVVLCPQEHIPDLIAESLDQIHRGLLQLDQWQTQIFGSASLALKEEFVHSGRIGAALIFAGVIVYSMRKSKPTGHRVEGCFPKTGAVFFRSPF